MTERTSGEPDAGGVEAGDTLDDALARILFRYGVSAEQAAVIVEDVERALPALGYSKADPAPSRSVRRRLDLMAQADPARVEAGQPQVVAWQLLDPNGRVYGKTTSTPVGVPPGMVADGWSECALVTLADALAYAEQQRQAAVGDGQVVVDRERMRLAVVYHGWQAERGGCPAGCEVPLGSSLADHALDVALGADEVVPERWHTRPDETREGS